MRSRRESRERANGGGREVLRRKSELGPPLRTRANSPATACRATNHTRTPCQSLSPAPASGDPCSKLQHLPSCRGRSTLPLPSQNGFQLLEVRLRAFRFHQYLSLQLADLPFYFHAASEPYTTPLAILSASKRNLAQYAPKLGESFEELFSKTSIDLEQAGLTPKERRYLLWILEKYRCVAVNDFCFCGSAS